MDKKVPVGKIGHTVKWEGEDWRIKSYNQNFGHYFVDLKSSNGRVVENVNYEEVEE